MLPLPLSDFIPRLLSDTLSSSPSGTALINKLEQYIEDWRDEIIEMVYLKSPDRCPSALMSELGYMIAADLLSFETEQTQRIKISDAIRRHKQRGSWTWDAKAIVDAIAGGDSSIIHEYFESGWITWAKESADLIDYTGTLGTDGVDGDLGLDLFGTWEEPDLPGIIAIDVDNASLTTEEVEQLVLSLYSSVPAYYRVCLGYHDGSGFYVVYPGGTIG